MLGLPAGGQEGAVLGADGAGKLHFQNPIRRAFTLPTILCGSFVGIGSDRKQEQLEPGQRDAGSEADEDSPYDYEDTDDAPPPANLAICDPFSAQDCTTAAVARDQSPGYRAATRRAARRARRSQPSSGSSSATVTQAASRLASPSTLHSDCDGSRGGADGGESLAPLSCLVTPIRRMGKPAGAAATTSDQHRRAHSSQRSRAQQSTAGNQAPIRLLGEFRPCD